MIEKFEIPDLDEKDLQDRLSRAKYPDEYVNSSTVGWKLGTPTWAAKDLVNVWKSKFSWAKKRDELNQWAHYRAEINGLKTHFVHEPSSSETAIPLLLLHGWPSSFYEFHKIIGPLRDGIGNSQAFHIVAPSLPGFGFSEAPKTEGFGILQIANTCHKVMMELGYQKYMIYCTDWGAMVGTCMAQNYSDSCLGIITNMPTTLPPLPFLRNLIFHPFKIAWFLISLVLGVERVYGANETKGLKTMTYANCDKDDRAGYRAIQGTRPYTLAFGLSDSPVGLLGWMLDIYHLYTGYPSAEIQEKVTLPETVSPDVFLTQVSIYWMTNTMSSSSRLYYEAKNDGSAFRKMLTTYIKVPMGVSYFQNEVVKFPRDWLAANANLIQFKMHTKGGHFPALEEPQLLMADIQEFVKRIGIRAPKQKDL